MALYPDTLTPGDAFTVTIDDGPHAEMILWARLADGRLICTWAGRGVRGFRVDEGPKATSAPFILTPGLLQVGADEGVRFTTEQRGSGQFVAAAGRYVAGHEASNGVSVMAAQYCQRLGVES